jgi:hypothetical protein
VSVPSPNSAVWRRLAEGGLARLKTQNLSTQLLTKRLERSLDPVDTKAAEIHAYFLKWERTLAAELKQIASF